jgi:hypothetical protein
VGVPELTAQGTRRSPYVGPTQPAVKWIRTELEPNDDTHPIIDSAGRIIIQTGDLELSIVTPAGDVSTVELPVTTEQYSESVSGFAADPLGNTYVAVESNLYALDAFNEVRHVCKLWTWIQTSPIFDAQGRLILCFSEEIGLFERDGTRLWTADFGGFEPVAAIGADGALYAGNEDGEVICIEPDGSERWRASLGDRIYQVVPLGDGTTLALRKSAVIRFDASGANLATFSFPVEDYWPRPHLAVGANDAIYVHSGTSLYTFAPDGTAGWASDNEYYYDWLSNSQFCSLILDANDVALFPLGERYAGYRNPFYDWGAIAAIDSAGNELWRMETASWLESSPLVASDGTLYLLDRSGTLYAIVDGVGTPPPPPQGLVASQGLATDHIELSWQSVNDASHYFVYRDGGEEAIARVSAAEWLDYQVLGSDQHPYTVVADGPFGESGHSDAAIGWLEVEPRAGAAGGWNQRDGNAQHSRRVAAMLPETLGEPRILDFSSRIDSDPLVFADGSILLQSHTTIDLYSADLLPIWTVLSGGGLGASCALGSYGAVLATPELANDEAGALCAINPNRTIEWLHSPVWGSYKTSPVVGPDDSIYIEDVYRVWHALNPDGSPRWYLRSYSGSWVYPNPGKPAAVAEDGTVYLIGEQLTPHDGVHEGSGNPGNPPAEWVVAATLNAVDPTDGNVRWSFVADNHISYSPTLAPDGTAYFTDWDHVLYSVDPTGIENWRMQLAGSVYQNKAITADGVLYVAYKSTEESYSDVLQAIEPDGSTRFIWGGTDTSVRNLIVDVLGRVAFNDYESESVICLDANGEELWRNAISDVYIRELMVNDAGELYVYTTEGCLVFGGEG